jgi:hypothetical protein
MASFYLRPSMIKWSSPSYSGTTLVLSDHNRSPLGIEYDRIENRSRMANATMRSYFVANKRKFDLSWENLPSRSSGPSGIGMGGSTRFTADGYSGANDMADFYEQLTGPFTMDIYVDDKQVASYLDLDTDAATAGISTTVFFANFSYQVQKRGQYFDLVNVSVSLEEA